jgi:hypothetical protein
MPAVELTSLNNRVQSLLLFCSDPHDYIKQLEELLQLYSSKKAKLGEYIPFKTLLPQLNVPQLVIEKIYETFPTIAKRYPKNILPIVDALWDKESIEYKILAIHLLLNLPLSKKEEANQRLLAWTTSTDESILHQIILEQVSNTELVDSPTLRNFIEEILADDEHELRSLAFATLVDIINKKDFWDLPWVFNLISPAIHNYKDLSMVTSALIEKSEIETVSFYFELYQGTRSERVGKFIRKILPLFTQDNQNHLQRVLRLS